MTLRVAINGFGRIGRNFTRCWLSRGANTGIELVGINGSGDTNTNAHLLKYDTVMGRLDATVEATEDGILVDGKLLKITAIRDPKDLPWKELGVDYVIESTGLFTEAEKAQGHIKAGAKKVIISAPATGEDLTIVMGVNEKQYDPAKHHIISNASCTTNCLAPAAKVISDGWGIARALMTTIHSYTNDQRILDVAHSDPRRARAAALNLVPASTGAAAAIARVIPELEGRFGGFSIRVPTPTVSIVDFTAELERSASIEAIHAAFRAAEAGPMAGILGVSDEPLVSSDYKGDTRSSIIDTLSTMMVGDKFVKIVTWYDNEWGYSCRVADLVKYVATHA